ncbi:MAG: RagB/SusD family nutrient uptake outer membrane protein [Bacteroidales bacterium]|nr:RagB/SusD family nutrient uptake outer membrane protein [Bacteroidales bacterium]
MKKNIIIVIAALFGLSACNLDQYPYSEVAADEYVKDATSVNNLVIGMYNGLYDVVYNEWAMTELRSDNARMRVNNSTSQDSKLIEQLDQLVVLTANSWVQDYWDALYVAVNRANTVIANLDVVEDAQQRARFEGEARFIRAWMYFNLVRLWGPVFVVTSKTGADEARYMQRSPSSDVWALIEEDLEAVVDEALLPASIPSNDLGRADLKAAKALLAKVYMTRYKAADAKYSTAANLLKEVLDECGDPTTGAQLVPYADVFDKANEGNAEIILAVRYRSGNLGIGSPFTTLYAPINNGGNVAIGSPKHYNYPSDNIISAFDANPGDLRKDVCLQTSYFNATTGTLVDNANARYCSKFIDPDMTSEWDAENDFPIIRLADVLLLYAEARNELEGPSAEALSRLNAVRERAGIPAYSLGDLPSKYAFRQAVREERRLELAFENQRFFDLLRWGTAVSTINAFLAGEPFYAAYDYVVNPISEWQTLLPIPVSVININKSVAQNPGY